MEIEEVFTSPFTTQTTCYPSGRNRLAGGFNASSNFELQFATENHLLGVRIRVDNGRTSSKDDVKTSCRPLPRDSAQLTCVGYASLEEEEEEETFQNKNESPNDLHAATPKVTVVRHVEAIGLIDPDLLRDHEASSSNNLHRPSPVVIEKDDNTSVATPETRSQSKRNSISTATSATNHPLSSGGYHRKSQSELSKGSQTTISDTQQSFQNSNSNLNFDAENKNKNDDGLSTQPKSKARLVLKQNQYTIRRSVSTTRASENGQGKENDDDRVYRRRLHLSAIALLDFRPLCPCIARWRGLSTSSTGDNSFLGVWVGSADDAVLRLYAPSRNDSRTLVPISLPEEHFSVDSPVMAVDYGSVSWNGTEAEAATTITHTLAVACQDGTIQLITWKGNTEYDANAVKEDNKAPFGEITSQKVIVDGPLVCLKLDYNRFASLRVIVGSLCGFVCQLTYDYNDKRGRPLLDSFWEGPHMVVQDLFHPSLNIEESVLTVDMCHNYVAVGTQLGRCLLYATHDSENFFLVWQSVLPYPVHNVVIIETECNKTGIGSFEVGRENKNSGIPMLAVTTRRSFHVFQGTHGGVVWKQKPKQQKFSSELAMKRLTGILEGIRKENEALDFATRKCVLEIIDALLETVESTVKSNIEANQDEEIVFTSTIGNQFELNNTAFPPSTTSDDPSRHPVDAPHWEYSSSDEDEPKEVNEAVQSISRGEEAEC